MPRVICLIDGFNLYHVLHSCHPAHCKWCNYYSLVKNYILPKDTLEDVYYFTALAKWNKSKEARHRVFIKAQEHFGVKVVLGNFKEKHLTCRKCHQKYLSHEEKETDINIASELLCLAYEDKYDKAIIVSGDSDYVSVIKKVKAKFPAKKIGVVIPYNSRKPHIANHIRKVADFDVNIERGHLLSSRLPNNITLKNGKEITCPPEYIRS